MSLARRRCRVPSPAPVLARPVRCALPLAAALVGLAAAPAGAAHRPPCTPRITRIHDHRATAFCGPATVTVAIGGATYRFRGGLCDRSATMGALEIDVGTQVAGATGNGGQPFVSLVIAQSPSNSEAFEADAGGRQLLPDSVIAQGAPLLSHGTFTSVLGPVFTGSWSCGGTIYDGP